ncbi:hypothetical protein M5689_020049 [Euphorbia peplus]|nr:hypothetical protein M5689_020049 [Euphorbia peplus]
MYEHDIFVQTLEFRRAGSRYILDMASVASEIVDTAVKHTMDLLSEQVGYFVHYKRNINDLKTILSKMEDMKNDIQRRIDDNRKNLSDVDDRLLHWLSASDDMHEQVTHFLQDELKWNIHSNLKSRYVKSNTLLTIGEVSEEDKLVLEGDTTNVEEDCALLEKVKDLRLVKVQKLKSIEQLMDTSKQITSPLDSQLQYFSNLRYLAIESCGYLKHMFPLYLCKMLSQLQKIRINDCIKMDGILYGKGQVDEVLLPYLTKLELISVPNLNSFWVDIDNAGSGGLLSDLSSEDDYRKGTSSSTQQLTTSEIEMESSLFSEIGDVEFNFVLFPSWIRLSNLEELRLHGCTLLRVAFTFTVAEHLVKLKTLEIRWCWKMEYIVATVGRPEGKDRRSNVPKPVFPKLTSFIVDDLPELMAFSSNSNFYLEWSSLEELKVSKCPKIKILASTLPPDWDITEDELLVSTNEILFKIPPQLKGSMNVKFLKVRLCDNLTHLFSTHAAKILTGLERMEIKYCDKMKEVVAEEEDEEEEYELSSLESVTFDGCFQLKRFSDKNSFSTPNLKELHINGSQYPLDGDFNSTIKKVMLSKLRISNMKQLVRIGRDQIPDEDSGEICDLEIEGCDKLLKAIPYNLIVGYETLWTFTICYLGCLELRLGEMFVNWTGWLSYFRMGPVHCLPQAGIGQQARFQPSPPKVAQIRLEPSRIFKWRL